MSTFTQNRLQNERTQPITTNNNEAPSLITKWKILQHNTTRNNNNHFTWLWWRGRVVNILIGKATGTIHSFHIFFDWVEMMSSAIFFLPFEDRLFFFSSFQIIFKNKIHNSLSMISCSPVNRIILHHLIGIRRASGKNWFELWAESLFFFLSFQP